MNYWLKFQIMFSYILLDQDILTQYGLSTIECRQCFLEVSKRISWMTKFWTILLLFWRKFELWYMDMFKTTTVLIFNIKLFLNFLNRKVGEEFKTFRTMSNKRMKIYLDSFNKQFDCRKYKMYISSTLLAEKDPFLLLLLVWHRSPKVPKFQKVRWKLDCSR